MSYLDELVPVIDEVCFNQRYGGLWLRQTLVAKAPPAQQQARSCDRRGYCLTGLYGGRGYGSADVGVLPLATEQEGGDAQ